MLIIKLVLASLVALLVTSCGGANGGGQTSSAQTPTTASTTSNVSSPSANPAKPVVSETVRNVKAAGAFATSVRAVPGDSLQFRTVLGRRAPANVRLMFARGPQRGLTVTATVDGHTSSDTVMSAGGGHLTVALLYYTCTAPPAPSFCPVHNISRGATSSSVTFRGSAQTSIFVNATLGPENAPGLKAAPAATAVVPPYKLVMTGRSVVPPTSGGQAVSSPFTSVVTVKPGDLVVLVTHVESALKGAPQRLTVTLGQGPGTSLLASASVPGGQASGVRIKSSTGSPMTLVLPRYTCDVPPAPTYCPPVKVGASQGKYTLVFNASPRTPPVLVLATVQQG